MESPGYWKRSAWSSPSSTSAVLAGASPDTSRARATSSPRTPAVFAEAFDARVVTNEEKTIEQRMADVEKWKQVDLPQELDRRNKELMVRLEGRFQSDLEAARKNVEDQYTGLLAYIKGSEQKWWESYRGPILLVAGVLVGTAANFVALG